MLKHILCVNSADDIAIIMAGLGEYIIRASIIDPSQLAIRIRILYPCLVGGERREERGEVGSHARAS